MQTPRFTLLAFLAASVTVLSSAASTGGGGTPTFEGWNVKYALPTGWQITQQQGRAHTLTPLGEHENRYRINSWRAPPAGDTLRLK